MKRELFACYMKQWLLGGRVPEHMFIPAAVTASGAKNVMCLIIPDMALKFLCWRYRDTYFFLYLGSLARGSNCVFSSGPDFCLTDTWPGSR